MKIVDILKEKFTVSFEFFPPKNELGFKNFESNLKALKSLQPDFVSVTYGAGGSTRDKTKSIIEKISLNEKINVMAHLTCILHNENELVNLLEYYKGINVKNILAMRGDVPFNRQGNFDITKEVFPHAINLMELIKTKYNENFSIGGAMFPEVHPESKNIEEDIFYLKKKIDCGMEFGITQLFYDNSLFYRYMDTLEKNNVNIPVLPGIMPITEYGQIEKFVNMFNASIPKKILEKFEKYKENPDDLEKFGIEYAITNCQSLIDNGVKGLHFYTLNKSKATILVYENIK
ncbi:MAG: methylenetetrahydrofolate reductase [NAD(P)H] [Fusobacteria bacterium]|nr:methylenetetrahydrofolate reductase [NAD(P)H] [Fusobacteriota bacterium]